MSRIRVPTDELRALRPLDVGEVAKKDEAIRRPGLVEAVDALKEGIAPGEDPFHPRIKDLEERASASASEEKAYVAPRPIPVAQAPALDTAKVEIADALLDPRHRRTEKILTRPAAPGQLSAEDLPSEIGAPPVPHDAEAAPALTDRWSRRMVALSATVLALALASLGLVCWWAFRPPVPLPQLDTDAARAPTATSSLLAPAPSPNALPPATETAESTVSPRSTVELHPQPAQTPITPLRTSRSMIRPPGDPGPRPPAPTTVPVTKPPSYDDPNHP